MSSGGDLVPLGVLVLGGLGALVLLVAEFVDLYRVRVQSTGGVVSSVTTGSHDAYALVPVAVAAALLAVLVWSRRSRPALLGLAVLGVGALLVALLGDLPDAHATGLVRGPGALSSHIGGSYVLAASRPAAGFYLETLGAVVLIMASGGAFLLLGPPPRPRPGE